MNNNEFDILFANETFQNDLKNFETLSKEEKKNFKDRYSISKEQFVQAKTVLDTLDFKEISFSEAELNYLWDNLELQMRKSGEKENNKLKIYLNWMTKIAAVLFVPLLVGTIWYFSRTSQTYNLAEIDSLTQINNTVYAPAGGKTKALLPDGTIVWLNSGSSIQYPLISRKDFREVKLTGEGFFDVVKNPEKPMLVTAGGMKIKVYGTSFNINAYEDNNSVETVLVEGSISILNNQKTGDNEFLMKPGEIAKFYKEKKSISISKTSNLNVYTGWVNGLHVFKNIRFKDILKRLERLHNVKFELTDKTLGNYYFDATFEEQNIDRIMEIFALSLPIKWESVNITQNSDNSFSQRKIVITRDSSKELIK